VLFALLLLLLSAAYEIPSDNLIAELADEYNAELSNFLDFDEAKCMSEGEGIEQCISGKLAEDAEWASSMEKAVMTAEPCLVDAMAKGDAKKIVKCALPVLDITDKYCSTAAFREACGMAPSMIEDFVLNLVEVLEVGECLVCCVVLCVVLCCVVCFEGVWCLSFCCL
jgi:hypothetical protein